MHIVYARNRPRFLEFYLTRRRESIPEDATILAVCSEGRTVEALDEYFFNTMTDEEYYTLRQMVFEAEQLEKVGARVSEEETMKYVTRNNIKRDGRARGGRIRLLMALVVCVFAFALKAQAATFQVTTAADNGDNNSPTPGSLREAVINANQTAGTDTITFNIGSGATTITLLSSLPVITDPVVIDGTTQPGFSGTPVIELTGGGGAGGNVGLQINSGGSTVRGMVINLFSTGIFLNGKGNNKIVGNFIGTDITGKVAMGNTQFGINVQGGDGNIIGGSAAADRNVISSNGNTGLRLSGSSSNTVLGNRIGTDVTGFSKLGNGNQGLRIENSNNNKVGGLAQGEGNIISGSGDAGVLIVFGFGNTITGNLIGTDAQGIGAIGNKTGGVGVLSGANNNIYANNIAFNGGLGIDLDPDGSSPFDGVTQNDSDDSDAGGNNLQNYPVITGVAKQVNSLTVQGTLTSAANKQFRLDFYRSSQCNPTGYGEGQSFLGSTNVTTNGNDATFNLNIPVIVPPGDFITATATDPSGNTSEFSKCVGGNVPGTLQFSAANYSVSEAGPQATITVTRVAGSTGAVSVKYGTVAGGTATGADYTTVTGLLNWGDNDSSDRTITISITDDSLDEANETVLLSLNTPTGGATLGSPSSATLTITDNDPTPSLSINDVTVTEGNSGTTDATFTVTLSAASGQPVSVNAAASGGTATSGQDFQPANSLVTFAPGQTAKSFTVKVNGDMTVEPDEIFSVFLTSPVNATISDNQGVATITNDDAAPVTTVQFEQSSYSVSETEHFRLINVTRTGDASAAASVDLASSDGSATQKSDYNITLGTIYFAPGETLKTVIFLVTDDSYVEGGETLNLNLSNAAGAVLGAQSQTTITITDDDVNPAAANAIADTQNFVRQQYHDFLNREPDPQGFQGWQNVLANCPASGKDANGNFCDRIEVSAGFYRSQEFHDRGYFIYRFYAAALGRIPKYEEFMRDLQKVSGFLSAQQQEDAKALFITDFLGRQEFKQKYDALVDPGAYVDALAAAAGVTLQNRAQIVQQLQANQITRGQALRLVMESGEVDQKFYDEAFVIMQYFGYLRRDADVLYLQWIQTLKQTGDYRALVNGFLNSTEYVLRFGK